MAEALWELTEEIKTVHCPHVTCASCHRVEAEASAETPVKLACRLFLFSVCKSVHSVKTPARNDLTGVPHRGLNRLGMLRLKGNRDILKKLISFIPQFWGSDLKTKTFPN